jgi:glyoxylase-like metal-dependent hydrolase (beta-lactamase superfamily II)
MSYNRELEAFPGGLGDDVVLYVEDRDAIIAGDTLIDRGRGLEILDEWLADGVPRDQVVEGLRPLLDLPVEVVLPRHGPPADRDALQRALAN